MITNIDPKIQISDEYRNAPEPEDNAELLEVEEAVEENEIKSYQNTLFLISGSRVREEEVTFAPNKPLLIGKSDIADLVLDEPLLCNLQLAIVKLGDELYFIDRGVENHCWFNGENTRQAVCYEDERMVVKLGRSWLIYDGRLGDVPEIDYNNPHIKVSSPTIGRFFSDYRLLLVGRHEKCDIILKDRKVKEFHGFFSWSSKGVAFEAFDSAGVGARINDMKVVGSKTITHDCTLQIGDDVFDVALSGNIQETVNEYFPKPNGAVIALSVIDGPAAGTRARLEDGQYTLGSGPESQFFIDDPTVSNNHAEIKVRNGGFGIEDKGSLNKTFVNEREVRRAMVYPGDFLNLGTCPLLVYWRLL